MMLHDNKPLARIAQSMMIVATLLVLFPAWARADTSQDQITIGVAPMLESQLLGENAAELARAARRQGDPARGAILFYRPALSCAKCHVGDAQQPAFAPDLAQPGDTASDTYLVESILQPSKVIKPGYETLIVVTTKGTTLTGFRVREDATTLLLRDAGQDFKPVTLRKSDIEERRISPISIMPAGLVNQLGTRQEFLDLVRYVLEIHEGGPARARALRPDPGLLLPPPLPDYEKHLDHAGLVASLDATSCQRGEAIYNLACSNCHGTKEQPGSLPTSLRFATGRFKNGSDPYSMYQTLTRGFGMMTPQTWMVPEQKYDVIHYIREAYLKSANPSQYVAVDPAYLERLPHGRTRGPRPAPLEPWRSMNYGPSLMATYEIGHDGSNFAYKGIGVRLDPGPGGIAQGRHWMVYDHDTMRVAAGWSGQGFIDWNSIHFNGRHQVHPRIVGDVGFANPNGPGWGNPADGSFAEVRVRGRDDKYYGPLPCGWVHYRGLYHRGEQVLLSYTVGDTAVLERPGLVTAAAGPIFTRTFNLGPRPTELVLQIAHEPGHALSGNPASGTAIFAPQATPASGSRSSSPSTLAAGILPAAQEIQWLADVAGNLRLRIPAGKQSLKFTLWITRVAHPAAAPPLPATLHIPQADENLEPLTHGGPRHWNVSLITEARLGRADGPFAVDDLVLPASNPWLCRLRLSGFDFLPDGDHAAVCSWDGDVWLVSGIAHPEKGLTWQRIASGLFQPLGLKVVNGQIYVGCRDAIVRLHDRNGDGEIDFYESFNSDHQVTEHFHEFAMDLQTDAAGNFYYCKGGRHALPAVVPHHGTLLRVSKDGLRTTIVATGLRAANGVCVNPDGTFFLTDQEGHWTPKNRINWVVEGGYYGYWWGYHDVTDPSDQAMKQPVCWITNNFDRSPAEILRVESRAWGPLNGTLLNLSYGTGKIFLVSMEKVRGKMQGGMFPLPIPLFPTGVMRGRFHPEDGQLYCCGLYVWAGNREQPGGFYRVRFTGKPLWVPLTLHARRRGLEVTFSAAVDASRAANPANYSIKTWSLRRSAQYGSEHYNEHSLPVTAAHIHPDGRTVLLEIPALEPTPCMELKYFLKGAQGEPVEGILHHTIYHLD
jgi:putative heme-binding domain-containing protein